MKNVKIIILTFFFISCQGQKDCEAHYDKYLSLRMEMKNDKALIALSKAIDCDKDNQDYRYESVQYLISLNEFSKAKTGLLELSKLNDSYLSNYPLYGLLCIKMGDVKKGEKELRKVYSNLSKVNFSSNDFNIFYSKLNLDLFFKGKEYVMKELRNRENIFNQDQEKKVLMNFSDLINTKKDSLSILYEIYQVGDGSD